jgi:hypothetical protein
MAIDIAFQKFGDWAKTENIITRLANDLDSAMRKATTRNALELEREMKKYIKSGKGFAKLHPFTIKEKGSSKPLIDNAELINSINHKLLSSWEAMVGLLRNAPHKGSGDTAIGIVNLGWLHEHGYQIGVTPKMRLSLAKRGLILSPSTTVIRVPARPFVRPVFENREIQQRFVERYQQAIRDLIRL